MQIWVGEICLNLEPSLARSIVNGNDESSSRMVSYLSLALSVVLLRGAR